MTRLDLLERVSEINDAWTYLLVNDEAELDRIVTRALEPDQATAELMQMMPSLADHMSLEQSVAGALGEAARRAAIKALDEDAVISLLNGLYAMDAESLTLCRGVEMTVDEIRRLWNNLHPDEPRIFDWPTRGAL